MAKKSTRSAMHQANRVKANAEGVTMFEGDPCDKCKETLRITYNGNCVECRRKHSREYAAKNREKHKGVNDRKELIKSFDQMEGMRKFKINHVEIAPMPPLSPNTVINRFLRGDF